MRTRNVAAAAGALAAGGVIAALAYPRYGRAWCLGWGATPEEVEATLPGDAYLPDPDILSTRAVTVDAPPSAVWPWLVQMGPGRAGAYTYDWVENLLGLDMHSADVVVPELQHLEVGDGYALGEKGPRMTVAVLDAEHALVFRSEDGHWVWAFVLAAVDGGTRLLSRNRIALPDSGVAGRAVNTLVMEPGSLVMERKMLLGIKQRAERLAAAA